VRAPRAPRPRAATGGATRQSGPGVRTAQHRVAADDV